MMNFVKGVIVGGITSASAIIMYNEIANKEKKMIIKRGKKILKNMGL